MWDEFSQYIQDHISSQEYKTWFSCIEPSSFKDNKLLLNVPTPFVSKYIEEHYINLMRDAILKIFGDNTVVIYKSGKKNEIAKEDTNNIKNEVTNTPKKEIKAEKINSQLDSQLCSHYTFENFIEGESNRLARSVGEAIAINPAQTFNPFFVFGPSGCGKTHLVNAIGLRAKKLHPEMRVLYLSAHQFYVQYANAIQENKTPEFISFYQTIDMLIIDDIQELSGKTGTQNAFFHIFNHLHINGKQIILAADRPPIEISGLEDRLLTRFKWGLQAEIEKPEKALRRAVMLHKVKTGGLNIPEPVITYIADNVNESIRDLEGIINSLNAYSVVYKMPINMKLVDMVLPKFTDIIHTEISIEDIKKSICKYYHINETELCSSSRRQPLSQIRQIAIYFASKLTKESTIGIGQSLGGRSHSTVIHSINQVQSLIQTDKNVKNDVEKLEEEISHFK